MQPLDVGTFSAIHYASTADFHFTLLGYLNALGETKIQIMIWLGGLVR